MKKEKPTLEELVKNDMDSMGYDDAFMDEVEDFWEELGIPARKLDVNDEIEIIGIKSIGTPIPK